MKFIDEVTITVQSGNGGAGCVSFRREKFIPRGGPDGGDGGKGGDVVFKATSHRRTLYDFQFKKELKAKNGTSGGNKKKTGKDGADIIIEIPTGTLIKIAETGDIIRDFTEDNESFIIAEGGRGGRGNTRFKTSTNRSPRFAQPGEPGKSVKIQLELKLIADVGIIGLPNAGKSTLIRTLSAARPKIADYPFTTLTPNLGVVQTGWGDPFIVADIPGLIEGAHTGAGLGIRFLRHIERTRVLVHLIDASMIDPDDPLRIYETINNEMRCYNDDLIRKPQIVALNKLDISGTKKNAFTFQSEYTKGRALLISAATGLGIDSLITEILRKLDLPATEDTL